MNPARSPETLSIIWCGEGLPLQRARDTVRALCAAVLRSCPLPIGRCSRSATDGLAVMALNPAGPVGVDVQSDVPAPHDLFSSVLHTDERPWMSRQPDPGHAFAILWTRKEALLKVFGVGLTMAPHRLAVAPVSSGWQAVDGHELGPAWVRSLPSHHGCATAVAVRDLPDEIVLRYEANLEIPGIPGTQYRY